ncbi:hypothetical protein [Azohydromonas lata]|uniref:Uncharacterized protein n=1 Tax=Azohydromonas lata TaxID=45677 RepID=A0ABU5IEE4_9BURK|nr:hypothetical protein [Azohydromonas lata]MDZ5456890.1 hypothetical protein [Azohydromonas lata]
MFAPHPLDFPVLYALACMLVAAFGRHHKWGFWGYLWASLLMSPLLGLLFVLAGEAPARRGKPQRVAPPSSAP